MDTIAQDGTGKPVIGGSLAFGEASRLTDERGFWSVSNAPAGEWNFSLRLRQRIMWTT